MSITLNPEVEAKLRDRAKQRKLDADILANELINSALDFEAHEYEDTVQALEDGMKAIREGRERPFSEFMKEHRERWPDPVE